MQKNTESIDAAGAITNRLKAQLPEQQKPGTLSKWADANDNHYWEFVGDGKTTASGLMEAIVEREADKSDNELAVFQKNQDFTKFSAFAASAASSLLLKDKPQDPPESTVIPPGKLEEISLKQLVGLIAPFMQRYAAAVAAHDGVSPAGQGVDSAEQRKMIGQVHSDGLALPID